jgi:DNA-binding CsgD family transcriptional regulator
MAAMPASVHADHAIPQDVLPYFQLRIEWRLAEHDAPGALDALEEALTRRHLTTKPQYTWPILVSGMRACADVTADAGVLGDAVPASRAVSGAVSGAVSRATDLACALRRLADDLPAPGAVLTALAATFAAESARATGTFDRTAWDRAAAAWADLERPYPLSRALLGAAEAAAADGDRNGAADCVRRAAELADRLGARPLSDQIGRLARRAGLPPAGDPAPTPAPLDSFGLTPREREVLRLVAAGRSNREIAGALFISAKTASVHVSNILGKLGVTSRGEAAATAHRLRLFD